MNQLSLRYNQLKFNTSGNLPTITEESIEYTSHSLNKQKFTKCNRLDLETRGSWLMMPINLPGHCFETRKTNPHKNIYQKSMSNFLTLHWVLVRNLNSCIQINSGVLITRLVPWDPACEVAEFIQCCANGIWYTKLLRRSRLLDSKHIFAWLSSSLSTVRHVWTYTSWLTRKSTRGHHSPIFHPKNLECWECAD